MDFLVLCEKPVRADIIEAAIAGNRSAQAANAVQLLQDRHATPMPGDLVTRSQTGRTATNNQRLVHVPISGSSSMTSPWRPRDCLFAAPPAVDAARAKENRVSLA